MELSTDAPVAFGPILPDPSWWMQRDFTRKYHAQVCQQELAFRERLSHLHASLSRQQLLQQEFSKNRNQILQKEYANNLPQISLMPPYSVLPKQLGQSSFCEVDSKTKVPEKCSFVDKDLLMSKELEEGSDNVREEKPEQQKTQTGQQQQARGISVDLDIKENPMKNDSIPSCECQRSSNSNQFAADKCFTCNKVFKTKKDFEAHLAGRKHAKKLSQKFLHFKDLSQVKDGSNKLENGGVSRLQEYGKNLQQDSSKSPDSVLSKQPGWSSFCEVDFKTEVLEECNFIDKELLMSKELKEGSENGKEEKSEQQKTQTEQQQQERDISDDLEKQEKLMKNDSIRFSVCQKSSNSNQLTTEECLACNKVFKHQKDFESHLAGRKHARQLVQKLICSKDLSEVKDGSKKCESTGDSRLQEYGKSFHQNCLKSPDSVSPKQPGQFSFCEVDSKTEVLENCNFMDKEVLMSKELKEGSDNGREEKSEQYKTQTEKQQQERDISDDLEKQQKSMENDCIPSSKFPRSSSSNQLTIEECLTCNKVFKSKKDFESHLAGRKHASQFSQRSTRFEDLSEVKDGTKKCKNAVDSRLQEHGKDLQQNGSKSPCSEMLKQLGWSSFYEVDSKSEFLDKCNFVEELLLSKELKEGSDDGREEKSEQQKIQTEQQQQESNIGDDFEKQEKSMKNDSIPLSKCQRSWNSNQLTTDKCLTCNKVFKSQKDFESHLVGRKHAKHLSQRLICFEDSSEFKNSSKKCENAGDSRFWVKSHVENSFETELIEKVKYDGDLVDKKDKGIMKENTEQNEQQQMMVGAIPSKLGESPSNLRELIITNCDISYGKADEQRSFEDIPVWKANDDRDLGATINELDMENAELIDQHQLKERNSKQQKVQIEHEMTEGNLVPQKLQMKQKMMERGTPSLKSNQSRTEERVACNIAINLLEDFESHLAGSKQAKRSLQRVTCTEALSEIIDDRKKCENAGDKILINIDSGLMVKDNVEKRLEKEFVEKVQYNEDFVAKEDNARMKENTELNEQYQIMVRTMPSKLCKCSSNLCKLSNENCKISYGKYDEQKISENKHVCKAKDDKDLGAKVSKVDMKKNTELINQHQMKEGNSKQQNVQIEQQMVQGNSKQRNPQMEDEIMESNQLRTEECLTCNKIFRSQKYIGSHLAGRKHDKMLLQRMIHLKALSEVKDGSKKCENTGEKKLSIDSTLLMKDDVEKRLEKELVEKVKYDGDLVAKEDKVGMRESAELNAQHQVMFGAIPSKLQSSNSRNLSVKSCKISYVRGDEQKSFENKLDWNDIDDKDLDAKIREVDLKENAELIDVHQMKEGNSKQQNPQMEQQMMEGEAPSLKSNQLRIEDCVACIKVLHSQDAFPSHLAGREHAKQLLRGIACVKGSEQKSSENKPVWKLKDNKDLGAKINEIDMKRNVELIDQDQMKGENSRLQKVQIEQQITEGESKQQYPQMEQQMMQGGTPSLKSNHLTTVEFVACNQAFNSQDDFESGFVGRKHAKQLSQTIKCEALSEVKDDSEIYKNAGEKILIRFDSGLLIKDNMEKKLEKELFKKVKYNGVLVAKEEKGGVKENAELNEQQQMIADSMPSKLCKRSSHFSGLSTQNCKTSFVKCDEQQSCENKPVWKAKVSKDLIAKINEVDTKENTVLIDKHQMKEGNSKQQKVQIEQQTTKGNSNQQNPQMGQQTTKGNSNQQNPQMEQQMVQGGMASLESDKLITQECARWNEVFNCWYDFESHIAGTKHAKQLQSIKCVKALSEVKDDSKKCEKTGEKILISSDSGLLVNNNMEKRLKKELCEKVNKYDDIWVAKEEKVGVKENAGLSEQQQVVLGSMPSKLCQRSSNLSQLSVKECKLSSVSDECSQSKPFWKTKEDKDLGPQINKFDMKESTGLIDHRNKEGNSKKQRVPVEQQLTEGNSKQRKPQMEQEQEMVEWGTSKEHEGSLNLNPFKFKECLISHVALEIQGGFEAHLSARKHAKQLKEMETKVWKVADDSDFDAKSNKVGMKETDEHELEQMNTGGMSSKVCKMLSNARQLSIEECNISKEKVDVNKSNKNKFVWKVKDDRNLNSERNRVDIKENAELNDQCLIKEEYSEQQNFQSDQKLTEEKSNQQKLQMEQMKGASKTQKSQMKQQIMENGLQKKQHEGLASEQLKVNGYTIFNTVLNFHGDSEVELARRKQTKQLKKMENKTVWNLMDKRDLCSKSDEFSMKQTTELSEKQHMKGMKETAELSEKQHREGMKDTEELSEKQHMKEGCTTSKTCKKSSNASQLDINEFKIPITKYKVDKGAINQSVRKVNEQQWMRKKNTKQQKL